MMRVLPLLALSALALSAIGCADEGVESAFHRKNARGTSETEETTKTDAKTGTATSGITVNGTVDPEATNVDIMAMDDKGELSKVGNAKVEDGKFTTQIPAGTSPTGVFILKAKGIGDAVVSSALLNGIPAFIEGFVVLAPLDAVTSFKAEILQTIAKKGVPGAQNFINVLDAYVDANLAAVIAVDSAVTNDAVELIGAVSDSVIAAEEVIEDSLRKAGFPVDFTALEQAQAMTTSGIQKFVVDFSNKRITTSKNLLAGFQKSLADFAAPIDDAIFNAVVNGSGAFGSKMKEKAPMQGFAASKSAFALTSDMSTAKMNGAFAGTSLAGKVNDAATAFTAAIGSAASTADLEAAKAKFMDAILGKDAATVFAPLQGFVKQLTSAFQGFDPTKVAEMLAEIDACAIQLPAKLTSSLGGNADLAGITDALRLVQKQVIQ